MFGLTYSVLLRAGADGRRMEDKHVVDHHAHTMWKSYGHVTLIATKSGLMTKHRSATNRERIVETGPGGRAVDCWCHPSPHSNGPLPPVFNTADPEAYRVFNSGGAARRGDICNQPDPSSQLIPAKHRKLFRRSELRRETGR